MCSSTENPDRTIFIGFQKRVLKNTKRYPMKKWLWFKNKMCYDLWMWRFLLGFTKSKREGERGRRNGYLAICNGRAWRVIREINKKLINCNFWNISATTGWTLINQLTSYWLNLLMFFLKKKKYKKLTFKELFHARKVFYFIVICRIYVVDFYFLFCFFLLEAGRKNSRILSCL